MIHLIDNDQLKLRNDAGQLRVEYARTFADDAITFSVLIPIDEEAPVAAILERAARRAIERLQKFADGIQRPQGAGAQSRS